MAKKSCEKIDTAIKKVKETQQLYHKLNLQNHGKPYSKKMQEKLLEALKNKRDAVSNLSALRRGGKVKIETEKPDEKQ